MKLTTKFLFIYLSVFIVVLGIGGVVSYHILKDEINQELKWEFLDRIDRITYLLEQGKTFAGLHQVNQDENLIIRPLSDHFENDTEVTDTLIWDKRLEQEERNIKVSAYRNVRDTTYFISTYGNIAESNDVREAVISILLWILGLQIFGAIGTAYLVSGSLFRPFQNTLKRIQGFQLNEKEYLKAENTNIQEFKQLNYFVEEMTKKAVSDYINLKEFTENASHELQTPIAIAKGTLELLAETNLDHQQYEYVDKIEATLNRVSKLNDSLALLTKIENHEFVNNDKVNFSELIKESINEFEEFVLLNKLELKTDIQENVLINMHPALVEILWANLFRNAILHNFENGEVHIKLSSECLQISNTGMEITTNPDSLFERFKKGNQNSKSIGLGLSIVKRITDQCGLKISYSSKNSWHYIEISLKSVKEN